SHRYSGFLSMRHMNQPVTGSEPIIGTAIVGAIAVGRARLAAMEWGGRQELFDWGLYMVYLQSSSAVLLPRAKSPEIATRQARVRRSHRDAAERSLTRARELDGLNFGEIMSELSRRRVLILGRFSTRRLPVLTALRARLAQHKNRYIPELFTFNRLMKKHSRGRSGLPNGVQWLLESDFEPRSTRLGRPPAAFC
ncbi:MAG TPA: hypothetical protein VLU06_12350, partial [Thermoanaerobaculia bacterium]|nr:hypothetical protein [Thermoanaerobaculia bacterium]